MFDISALKNMKLSELQDIAKLAKTIKFAGVKKEDLISQILEQQATSSVEENTSGDVNADKPKHSSHSTNIHGNLYSPNSIARDGIPVVWDYHADSRQDGSFHR
jgi:transcription termination factor Rho